MSAMLWPFRDHDKYRLFTIINGEEIEIHATSQTNQYEGYRDDYWQVAKEMILIYNKIGFEFYAYVFVRIKK